MAERLAARQHEHWQDIRTCVTKFTQNGLFVAGTPTGRYPRPGGRWKASDDGGLVGRP